MKIINIIIYSIQKKFYKKKVKYNRTLKAQSNECDKKSIKDEKKETVGYEMINNEINIENNSTMEKEFKKNAKKEKINKEDTMDFFKTYFNLNDLKILEKSLTENSQYNNINECKMDNENESIECKYNSNTMIDYNTTKLDLIEKNKFYKIKFK